jgi:hypothetical protein
VTGATTLPEFDWQFEHVRIQASAANSPDGRRKYSFCIVLLVPKKIFSGLAITATAVTFVAIFVPVGPDVPAPHEIVSFE